MKLLRTIVIALSATLALGSCSDDNDPAADNGNASISLSSATLQVGKEGGTSTVTVTSTSDWRLAGTCDWAHPSATSGKSGDEVTFTIDPNTDKETRKVTFKFFTGASVAPLEIESAPSYTLQLISEEDKNITVSNAASTASVRLITNVANPEISFSDGGDEWVSFGKRSDFIGKTSLNFNVKENEAYKSRSTTITIANPFSDEKVEVNLTQKQTDALIISEDVLSQVYDLEARTISFQVKTNLDYQVITNSKWMTNQTISTPIKGEDGLSTYTVSYDLAKSEYNRSGKISITATGFTRSINVVQKEPNAKIVSIPDSDLFSTCLKNGWIIELGSGKCIVSEAGMTATTLNCYYAKDMTGIENFPNLTSITMNYCNSMEKFDISGLHKVTSVSIIANNCAIFNLGDNPVTSFSLGGVYSYSYANSFTFISTALESLDLSITSWYIGYDKVTSIDVSGCPALKTLNANRSDKIKTLYLKQGQTIENLTKNDATEIVYK